MSEAGFLPEAPLEPGVRPGNRLGTLCRIARQLNSVQDPQELLGRILELALAELGAERGLIFLVDPLSGELETRVARHVDRLITEDALAHSRRVVFEVGRRGQTIFSGNAQTDVELAPYRSVRDHRISSLICVPLSLRGSVQGTIYVDTRVPGSRFSREDLTFLEGFADLAAIALENAQLTAGLREENTSLRQQVESRYHFDSIVGDSPSMQRVYRLVERVLDNVATVLITGETGTGKELIARAIHYNGARRRHPLVTIDCGALPESLAEREFFGHLRGSFTDAHQDKPGLLEKAHRGTIFIDEVGDITLDLQAKLLRFLQEGEVRRIGETRYRKVDIRVIAASNRDLRERVEEGSFRRDLYYRLNVVPIHLPPLRERREDIPTLALHCLRQMEREVGRQDLGFAPQVMEILLSHHWEGNVRELENTVRRAVVLSAGDRIEVEDLPDHLRREPAAEGRSLTEREREAAERVARQALVRALRATRGDVAAAARLLHTPVKTVYHKLKVLGISARTFRE